MTGFEAFCLYQALKLHFSTDSYDFTKYNGKTNMGVTSFDKRKDKYFFYKLSRKFPNDEILKDFLVSNFVESDKTWIGDLLSEEADSIYLKRQKFLQSITYIFENECESLVNDVDTPNDMLKVESGDYPLLLTKVMRKEVHLETLCILNMILGFLPMWKDKIRDTVIWPQYLKKIEKYSCFLPKDVVKYKLILKKVMK